MIAAQVTGAGGDEISYACQSGEGERIGPGSNPQARYLGQSPRDEGSFRVIPIAQAITDACTDGDDVFECSTQFNPNDIMRVVDTKRGGGEQRATFHGYLVHGGSD